MTTKKQRRQPTPIRPQAYEHRTEVAIYALRHALQSVTYLTLFLTEQLGTDWQRLDHLLAAARAELKQADVWLKKQKSGKRLILNQHHRKEKGKT